MLNPLVELLNRHAGSDRVEGRWISPAGWVNGKQATDTYCGMITAMSGLSREESHRFAESMPDYPRKAEACCRMAWLKHNEKVLVMLLNITRNGIKKMEEEAKQP